MRHDVFLKVKILLIICLLCGTFSHPLMSQAETKETVVVNSLNDFFISCSLNKENHQFSQNKESELNISWLEDSESEIILIKSREEIKKIENQTAPLVNVTLNTWINFSFALFKQTGLLKCFDVSIRQAAERCFKSNNEVSLKKNILESENKISQHPSEYSYDNNCLPFLSSMLISVQSKIERISNHNRSTNLRLMEHGSHNEIIKTDSKIIDNSLNKIQLKFIQFILDIASTGEEKTVNNSNEFYVNIHGLWMSSPKLSLTDKIKNIFSLRE